MPLKPPVIILAAGAFPEHIRPLEALRGAGTLICCDGAADHLLEQARYPDVVVGDLDSISEEARAALKDRLVVLPSQQLNDLEKAIQWAAGEGAGEVIVLGATGLRDDHSLGNLLLPLTDFGIGVRLLTDTGQFAVARGKRSFRSFGGQRVALFPQSTSVRLTTDGLAYPLSDARLTALHKGTSNRSLGDSFWVDAKGGAVLVFQSYPEEG